MRIAVLSGKGGTGKTFVSVNLAVAANNACYVDCDAETPNGRLFLDDGSECTVEKTTVLSPIFDKDACTGCRACVDFCAFGALALVGGTPLLFDEVCHSCGGCRMVCNYSAISEQPRQIGQTESSMRKGLHVLSGRMDVGQSSGIPVIQDLLAQANNPLIIIDCPPGTACSAAECARHADYCLIVAEPSLYGTHNLQMVHEMIIALDKPCGVVMNKVVDLENPAEQYCAQQGLEVFMRIPFDRDLARNLAEAKIMVEEDEKYRLLFHSLLERVQGQVMA